jgi:hypothetical protein
MIVEPLTARERIIVPVNPAFAACQLAPLSVEQ